MASSSIPKTKSPARRRKKASLEELLQDKVRPQQPFSGVLISFQPSSGWFRDLSDQLVTYTAVALFAALALWILSIINPLGLMGQGLTPELGRNLFVRRDSSFPVLNFSVPESGLIVLEPTYVVSGRLSKGEVFLIDGQAVNVDDSGAFSQAVPLLPEANLLHFTVVDGESRVSSVREVTYQVDSGFPTLSGTMEEQLAGLIATESKPSAEALELSVTVFPEATTLILTLDKKRQEPVTLSPGGSYTWSAQESIVLETSNAASTVVYLNHKAVGVMGEQPTGETRAFTWGDVR